MANSMNELSIQKNQDDIVGAQDTTGVTVNQNGQRYVGFNLNLYNKSSSLCVCLSARISPEPLDL